jgi:membrane protein DedA with SNARE-associated domain
MDLSFYGTDLPVWLMHYGSIALFILLGMGIFGLPVPEETLMVLAGILMSKGDLAIAPAILAAYLGTVCGITISYFLGRTAGYSLRNKYKKWLHLEAQPSYQESSRRAIFSKRALLIGYLIPGLRHFTGIFAGSTAMHFKEFAQFAYTGAFLWISLYLSIGYFWSHLFTQYAILFQNIEMAMELTCAGLILIFIFYIIYQKRSHKGTGQQ